MNATRYAVNSNKPDRRRPPSVASRGHRLATAVISGVLLALPGVGMAQTNFQVTVSSDPQYPWSEDPAISEDEKIKQAKIMISSQYKSMTKLQVDMQQSVPVLAALVNGDLTAFGHDWQLSEYESLLGNNLQVPVFLGLGNHDYANNVDDCYENGCASRMVDFVWARVRKMNPVSYDFKETTYYEFPSLRAKYEGSLAYSFNIGRVHFVQLENYPTYERSWNGWNAGKARRDHYEIRSSMDWLENDVITARNNGDAVILNLHDYGNHFSGNADFTRIINTYGVSGVFSGHIHSSIGYVGMIGNAYHFRSGSSTFKDYLLVEYKLATSQMIVKTMANDLDGNYTIVSTVGSYPVTATVPNPPYNPVTPQSTLTLFNKGGYVARCYLDYLDRAGTKIEQETGKMLLGNKKVYTLPAGSSSVHVKCKEKTGLVWDPWRTVFNLTYVIPPNSCFKMYGTTLSPKWNNDCS